MGGQSAERQLTSVETFGFENCTIPSLPETRYGFGSFITPTQKPQLAVCGGWWMGKPNSTDCLTLNVTSGQWERGTFTNELVGDGVRSVINMEGQGIFMVHSSVMSFLAPGSRSWVAGLVFPTSAECGCNVSSLSFVTIHMNDTHNVREYSVTNGEVEPQPIDSWPHLLTKRRGLGCGATSHHLIVAGGVSGWGEVLTSVEVFHIASKALRRGGNLQQARAYFKIIPVGSTHPRLLAVGGVGATSTVDTSEWWEEEDDSWEEGPTLSTGRSGFSAVMAPPHLVCTQENPPAHSCPGVDNNQTCLFSTAAPGAYIRSFKCQSFLHFPPIMKIYFLISLQELQLQFVKDKRINLSVKQLPPTSTNFHQPRLVTCPDARCKDQHWLQLLKPQCKQVKHVVFLSTKLTVAMKDLVIGSHQGKNVSVI